MKKNILIKNVMSTEDLLKEIAKLPVKDKLLLVEETIKSVRNSADDKIEKAIEFMIDEYKNDKELTALTALDFEDFYELK